MKSDFMRVVMLCGVMMLVTMLLGFAAPSKAKGSIEEEQECCVG